MRSLSSLVLAALLLASCSSGSSASSPTPTTSSASPIGIWAGSISDPVAGEGSARVSFAELPPNNGGLIPTPQGALGGTWSATFRNGEAVSGQSFASPTGNGYVFFLYPDVAPCLSGQGPGTGLLQYSLINAAVTSRTFTAVVSRGSCVDNRFGSITLTRQ